jgi:hypothetical protein
MDMGFDRFDRQSVERALEAALNNRDQATEHLLAHSDSILSCEDFDFDNTEKDPDYVENDETGSSWETMDDSQAQEDDSSMVTEQSDPEDHSPTNISSVDSLKQSQNR